METFSSSRTWIGVVVAVAGNVTISLALNCQKLAHTRLQKEQDDHSDGASDQGSSNREQDDRQGRRSSKQSSSNSGVATAQNGHAHTDHHDGNGQNGHGKSSENGNGMDTMFLQSKLWWLGLALMTIGEGGNFISYGFAPASLVAPLGAVALLSNVIISPILLGERFRISDIGGILLAIIGAVTVVFSSKQNDVRLDPDELLQAIKRLEFVIYSAVSVSLGAVLAFASGTRLGDRWVLIDVGTCAIFGGFTVLSTKGISSLISGGQPIEALKFPITYVLILVLAVTAVVQITYLNRALQRFDSREVIPTQFVFFTISAIVGSAILYRDFENMDAHRLINFLFGCLTTFAGVFVLTWRNHAGGEEGRDEEVGDESVESEQEADQSTEQQPLLFQPTPRQQLHFEGLPSNALRVPSSSSAKSRRRPRSRTNSPHKLSSSFDRSSTLSRSASNQPSAGLLSSSSRTPKLGLISMDRPTGLSSGHYLLLATPSPSFTLNPVAPVPAGGAKSGVGRGLGGYGATGRGTGALLPMPITEPSGSGRREEGEAPAAEATAAETITTPVVETAVPTQGEEEDLKDRLLDHVNAPRDGGSGSR